MSHATKEACTLPIFLDLLAKIKSCFRWDVKDSLRGKRGNRVYCPLTAVALLKTRKYFSLTEWDSAAEHLGVDFQDALSIMCSADKGHDAADGLRHRMIKILNP